MIRGRPLQAHTEPQSEVIAGVTLATSSPEKDLAVLQARLAASRYAVHDLYTLWDMASWTKSLSVVAERRLLAKFTG